VVVATTKNVLDALAQYAPEEIRRICAPGPSCILATKVGVLALAEFRVVAQPFPVVFSAFNQAWRDWADADFVGGAEEQLRRGAHLLTNTPDWKGGALPSLNPAARAPWDGHLVLRVSNGALEYLVDLDLSQCARPTKGIHLPPAVVAPISAANTVEGVCTLKGTTSYLAYQPLVAPYADEYRTAKDWVREGGPYLPVVAAITRKMKLALGK
jgi:hypothetical protein